MALKRTVNRHTVLFCAFLMLAAAHGALAQGDAGRGEVLADTCRGCHSIEDYKNVYPTYYVPKLGGQNSAYIVVALAGYRSQQREHPTMRAQAGDMTNQEMQDIAAYFATYGEPQTGDTVGTAPGSANVCVSCHGESGISIAEIYPNLAGQHEDYLVNALSAYKNSRRENAIMAAFVATLDEAQIQELAAYYSSQSGLFTLDD